MMSPRVWTPGALLDQRTAAVMRVLEARQSPFVFIVFHPEELSDNKIETGTSKKNYLTTVR